MKFRNVLLLGIAIFVLSACSFSLAEDITPPADYQSPTPGATDSPLFPQAMPDVANGQVIFAEKCAPCHGSSGQGDGPMAAQLQKPPAALANLELGRKSALVNWYTTVTDGNINSFMPPFKDGLNDQERWDVVAYALSLGGYSSNEAMVGKGIYESACVQCHGQTGNLVPSADFNDQALMSKLSQNDIANFVVNGVGKMPGFGNTIPQDQLFALASYVRTFTLPVSEGNSAAAPEITEVVATATAEVVSAESSATVEVVSTEIATTPEAAAADATTATVEGTPAAGEGTAQATEAVAAESPTPEAVTGSISGKITNGSGSTFPSGMVITLHGFSHNVETQQFDEVLTAEGKVNPDGSYSFEDVSFDESQAFYTSVDFSDTTYNSDPGFIEPGKTTLDLPLNIYETTTDKSTLKANQVHLLLDYTNPDVAQVVEFLIFSNTGNKSIVAAEKGGSVIEVPLPIGFTNLQFESGAIGDRFLKTTDGFADTTAILPGDQQQQIVFAVDLPLSKPNLFGGRSIEISQKLTFDVTTITILAPEGITVKGSNVTAGGLTDMGNGAKYLTYTATLSGTDKMINLTVSGTPKDSKVASSSSSAGIIIGVGSLGLVLILVGIWMYFRSKKQNEDDEEVVEIDGDSSEEEVIMDSIIALDDQYKNGKIEESVYKNRRTELTEKLKNLKS